MAMTALEGVGHAREIEPTGAVRAVGLPAFAAPCAGWRWLHLGRKSLEARDWLRGRSGLPETVVSALLETDTRPRLALLDEGALLILRGVNRNPGAQPEDMISLRLFIEPHRLITVEGRRLQAVEARLAALDRGETPSLGAALAGIVAALREDAEPVLDQLQQAIDGLEIEAIRVERALPVRRRHALNDLRHDAIQLHRHIAPQGKAVEALARARPDWLGKRERDALRREGEAFTRIAEDLEAVRSRAVVISDEAALRVAEETNRLMATLSIISVIFLPLTFATGLLGVNLAGIPFAEADWSFDAFALSLIALAVAMAVILRRLGLI
jgi:zinc transporter